MSRVIYSLYIDIPDKELDLFDKNILRPQGLPTNYYNKKQFRNNYRKLLANKKWYADNTADFLMFEYGPMYKKFELQIKRVYPFITTYNIVNFFKLKLLYELTKEYEEILYLDFDVVCLSKDNFFDNWNLNKGIAVFDNTFKVNTMETITKQTQTIRSPTAKYYNAQAMLIDKGFTPKNKVINTGIVGANKEHLDKLKYFDNFDSDMAEMSRLTKGHDMYPKKITDFFGWDNETLFAVKIAENNVPIQWLNQKWHYFFSDQGFVPKSVVLCHAINKKFHVIWRAYNNA